MLAISDAGIVVLKRETYIGGLAFYGAILYSPPASIASQCNLLSCCELDQRLGDR